jgi:hypothetical protein
MYSREQSVFALVMSLRFVCGRGPPGNVNVLSKRCHGDVLSCGDSNQGDSYIYLELLQSRSR